MEEFWDDTDEIADTSVEFNQAVSAIVTSCIKEVNHDIQEGFGAIREELQVKMSSGANIKDFFLIMEAYNDGEFESHFRMQKSTMQKLFDYLKEKHIPSEKELVQFETKVLVTVWLLANKGTFREASNIFGMEKSSANHIFHEMCHLISSCRHEIITWPDENSQKKTASTVFAKYGYPNSMGFIDGCHVQIKAPPNNPVDFFNRKDTHSVILQGVCDQSLKFIDVYLGHTGRAHDARVFNSSNLKERIHEIVYSKFHILGDAAYRGTSRFIIYPYIDNGYLTQEQTLFNTVHSKARATIERAFGLLKGKFRKLKYLECHKVQDISVIICACCVLHNFIIINESDDIEEDEDYFNINADFERLSSTEKRDIICNFINAGAMPL